MIKREFVRLSKRKFTVNLVSFRARNEISNRVSVKQNNDLRFLRTYSGSGFLEIRYKNGKINIIFIKQIEQGGKEKGTREGRALSRFRS